jgi:hypothetical protein
VVQIGQLEGMIEQNVGQAEDGCVSADPETKGEHGHGSESRAFEQHASRIAKIFGEEVHPGPVSSSVSRPKETVPLLTRGAALP